MTDSTILINMTSLDIAKYFIDRSNKEGRPITNKKLQKLVYYAQAWSLVLNNKQLFNEPIEAWVHGPAIRDLYIQYKKFGFGPIQEDIKASFIDKISDKTKELLDQVWVIYGKFDSDYLEMLSHSETPWQEAREGLQDYQNSDKQISLESMRMFYMEKLV